MRTQSKAFALFICLLIMVLLATACSSGGNSPAANNGQSGTGDNTSSPSSGTDSNSSEKVKLKFTFWGSPQEKKAVEDAIKAFEAKNPNVTIESIHIPGTDFLQKLNAMIAGNEAPDISYSAAWKLKMGEEGLLCCG